MSAHDEVLAALGHHGVLPVAVVDGAQDAAALGQGLADGGLPVVEVTLRTPGAAEAIRRLAATDLLVGAGTVVSAAQVHQVVDLGAAFVVSPGLSLPVVEACAALGVPLVPGVATASEVMAALAADLRVLKFFPAEQAGGLPMLRALAGPFPGVRFIPTGGIDATNAPAYLQHHAVHAVGGTWILPGTGGGPQRSAAVTRAAGDAVALVAAARSPRPR
ncbi:MAG: bifunctional 4-hydroxy-2-oxoglutarate aldolase/2-dehydro-3-deoxy-phosphogluconate aldolase [Nitriliruptoraceae bacterium]|nr:bifunctional 4-hydroxy-2-oxoglutarate aldolase/2-dehydro-3-deoxy-phosphogluconate aldolase [Nitriliruptoraceae bacterium]